MAAAITPKFAASRRLEANPYLYDYLHCMSFSPSGAVDMLDGGGQYICAHIMGHYSAQERDRQTLLVQFSDLVEVKDASDIWVRTSDQQPIAPDYSNVALTHDLAVPTYHPTPIRDLAPATILCTREEGTFACARHVMWNVSSAAEWSCLLYRVRCVFEVAPLAQVRDRRTGHPYF